MLAGGENVTLAVWVWPTTAAIPMVGAPGRVACGVAIDDTADGRLAPMILVAVTVKV